MSQTARPPDNLTEQQEAFARALSGGASLTKAYKGAYEASKMAESTVISRAKALAKLPNVAARISVLQGLSTAAAVRAIAYTLQAAINEADEIRLEALKWGNQGAAVSAAALKAKLAGYLIERKEVRSGPLEDADVAELLALRKALQASQERERAAAELTGAVVTSAPIVREGNRPVSRPPSATLQ